MPAAAEPVPQAMIARARGPPSRGRGARRRGRWRGRGRGSPPGAARGRAPGRGLTRGPGPRSRRAAGHPPGAKRPRRAGGHRGAIPSPNGRRTPARHRTDPHRRPTRRGRAGEALRPCARAGAARGSARSRGRRRSHRSCRRRSAASPRRRRVLALAGELDRRGDVPGLGEGVAQRLQLDQLVLAVVAGGAPRLGEAEAALPATQGVGVDAEKLGSSVCADSGCHEGWR